MKRIILLLIVIPNIIVGQLDLKEYVDIDSSGLPVEIIDFYGDCGSVSWITASEINNDYYILQMSNNSYDWSNCSVVDGVGTSNNKHMYRVDVRGVSPLTYYRLLQVDYNGYITEYNPIVVQCEESSLDVIGVYTSSGSYLGVSIPDNINGLIIVRYSNGSTRKFYNR